MRLVRDGNVNRASQLEPEKVRGLWKNPLLCYSNVDEQPLRRIVESLSEDWATAYLKEQMGNLLDEIEPANPTDENERKIKVLFEERSGGWAEAKEYGERGVPAGDAAARLMTLLAYLREVGPFVVPEGELEGFARGVPGHGPMWVNRVLERGLRADGSLTGTRDLVDAVTGSF